MEDLKIIFAQNLIALRKRDKLTQAELAEKINYSDKAVSKWERGESIPDVAVLKSIGDHFGVTIDFLITQRNDSEAIKEQSAYARSVKKKNKVLISIIPTIAILLVATIAFVCVYPVAPDWKTAIYCFVFPLPLCAMLEFIFSAIWGKKVITFIFVSLFLWLLILDVFFIIGFTLQYYPLIFIVGLPTEIVVAMSFGIIKLKK
ncbi:MAG: helix-turn-helix transcriptional regulator [Clostridia bacterium]|nr:helix-turn-helix transcriptional regulator [Clostridia bacterium]